MPARPVCGGPLWDRDGVFFKERLRSGETLRGVFNVIPSAVTTQVMAAAGADFVVIDREHGPIGRETLHAMVAATAGTGCAPLVRVPGVEEGEVKVALDAGAEGIVFPLVRTAADAERCVALVTYPPAGRRGWGPFAAHARHGTTLAGYADEVGPHVTCCVLLETAEAVEHVDAILAVPGVDLAVVAPFDLSGALGVPGDFEAAAFLDAVARIERAAAARQVPLGGVALTPAASADLIARGYRVLACGIDTAMLAEQVAAFREWN
jgi:4-hydroxy-2-oxoheptanedioate aldolase